MRQGANGVSDAVSMRAKLSRPWKSPTTSRASASRSGVWPLLALGVVPLVAAVALTTAVPTGPATAAVTGTKRLIVLRVHFNDYTATSHYTKAQVDGLFANLDQLYKNMSYGRMNLSYQVSDLYKLPSNRSAYIDDFSDGDLSNGGKFDKVLNDAIANAPSGLNWSNIDGVMVLMAETNTSQFHRGQGTKCTLAQGPGGANKLVGCAIFSENPSQSSTVVWGRWAHEIGHAFQEGGPAHPSNYNSSFELMDALMPGQSGVYEKQVGVAFTGWMPDDHYQNIVPNVGGSPPSWAPSGAAVGGALVNIRAEEYDPTSAPNLQAARAYISGSLYFLISVRQRVKGDELVGEFTPSGIPDEGVLIERVQEGGNPSVGGQVVEVMAPPGKTTSSLWHQGDSKFFTDGVLISIGKKIDDANYEVRVSYDQTPRPDMMVSPWRSPPGNTWESTDIWVDSPVNGYGTFRYGTRQSNFGDTVPVGNGDNPTVGQQNRLTARVRNLGITTATDVVVNFDRTDPEGRGIAGSNGFITLGSVSKTQFPGLASIAPGAFVDVYVNYTPAFTPTPAQIAAGNFYFHTCVRVRINAVTNETVLGNQDGDGEQENIDYFQATTPGPPSSAPTYKSSFRLRNDDALQPKHFRLTYDPQVPAGWQVTVNGGQLDLDLTPGEIRTIPVTIDPGGASSPPAGTIYWVDIDARYERELTNPTLPPGLQKHLEFRPLGGVRIESRVVRPVKVKCQATRTSTGTVRVVGVLTTAKTPRGLRVMVQGLQRRRYLAETSVLTPVKTPSGAFVAFLRPRKRQPDRVVCLFAGTRTLASAGAGPVPIS
jgi:hypothetical protein